MEPVLFVTVTLSGALAVLTTTEPNGNARGETVTVGWSAIFATNASDVPLSVVCKAPGFGQTGRFDELVLPVM